MAAGTCCASSSSERGGPLLAGSLWALLVALHTGPLSSWLGRHCRAALRSSCDTVPLCCPALTTCQVRALQPAVCHRGAGAPLVWRGQPGGCRVGHLCHARPRGQQGGRPQRHGRSRAGGTQLSEPLPLRASPWEGAASFATEAPALEAAALKTTVSSGLIVCSFVPFAMPPLMLC